MLFSPTLNWLRLLGGTADDTGFVLASSTDGGIFLGGETNLGSWDGHINQGRRDGFVARYDTNGLRTWTRWYATNQDDQVRGLTLGLDGSLYVSGGTLGDLVGSTITPGIGASDGFISRIAPSGSKQWTLQVGGSSWDLTRSLASSPDGSAIYAIGYTASSTFAPLTPPPTGEGTPDAYILKINPDKTIQWASRLGFGLDDYGMNLAVGADGFIYATGFVGTSTQASQAFLVKLNPLNGQEVWRKLIGTALNDYAESIRISSDNYLYVLLSTDSPLNGEVNKGNRDVAVQKYDFNGNRLWTVLHGSAAKEEGRNLTIGNDNSIYITGYTTGNLGGQINKGGEDAFISKITPSGVVEWTKLLGTPGNDVGWDVTTTTQGDLIVTGLTNGNLEGQLSNGGQDIFLASVNIKGVADSKPAATFAANLTTARTGPLLGGQLTASGPPSGHLFKLLTPAPAGFALQADGRWSFNPGDPAYSTLGTSSRQALRIAYAVQTNQATPKGQIPSQAILVGGPNGQFLSLQQALNQAPAGAIIYLAPGVYKEDLTISKNVTILGTFFGVPASEASRGLSGQESVIFPPTSEGLPSATVSW